MTQTRLAASVSAFALVLGAPALAQDGTISIYTYQTEVGLDAVGATVDVLDEDQIEDLPEASLAAVLDTLPGVSAYTNGPLGSPASVRLRGLPDRYTSVLYNGIEITDPSAPQNQFDWANILLGDVSRVEVLRGSQSARFGANAIGGAIAMSGAQAPDAPGTDLSINAEAGSYTTRRTTLSFGAATETVGVAISWTRAATDGFSAIEGLAAADDTDGFEGEQLSFDTYVNVADGVRLGLSGFRQTGTADYDNCYDSTIPPFGATSHDCYSENDSQGLRAYAEISYGDFSHVLDMTRYDIERGYFANGIFQYGGEGERKTMSYRGSWSPSETYTLSFGLDHKEEDVTGAANDAVVNGIFIETLYAPIDGLDLALSLRRDDHSAFGIYDSGRASLSYQIGNATLRAVAATGFRAPSLNELYGAFGANPGLTPETSRSFELGADYAFANGASIGATLFKTEIDDLIQYVGAGYTQTNGTSKTKGVELTALFPLGLMAQIEGAYTYTDAVDPTGAQLARMPKHDLSLTLSGDLTDRVSGALTVTHKADWAPTAGGLFVTKPVEDFTVANARIGYEFAPGIEGYARIENLFNTDYQVIPDYQTAGRSVYFGINADF